MLVLTRKPHENILIGHQGNVTITILSITGHHVKLGITAPREMPVHREEIYLKIQATQRKKEDQEHLSSS